MSSEREESEERSDNKSTNDHDYMVKLRGISCSTSKDDIKKFLYPCHVMNVHLFDNTGASSNDCFADLESDVDVKDALRKTGQYLDKRYIEVYRASVHEYNFYEKNKGMVSWREPVIRMSGLPFSCTMADVQNFFESIEIAKNGIYITRDMADKALGDGFVAFVNMENAYKALDLHDHKNIQHRYIELFPSTYDEAKRKIMNDAHENAKQFVGDDEDGDNKNGLDTTKRNGRSQSRSRSRTRTRSRSRSRQCSKSRSKTPEHRTRDTKRRHSSSVSPSTRSYPASKSTNSRFQNSYRRRSRSRSTVRRSSLSRNEEHLVKIRGMPYTVVEEDIRKFFPSSCQPTRIEILQDRRMKRPNGDGNLYFSSLDAVNEALKYDRKYMGNRYVELYFDSPRYASLSNRRRRPDTISRRSSHSPAKSKYNRYSRSRSDSMN